MNDFIDEKWLVLDDLKKELNGIIDKAYNLGHHKGCETTKQLLQMSVGMNKPSEEGSPREMTDQEIDGWKQGYQAAIDELKAINAIRTKGKWIVSGQVREIGGYSANCSICREWSEYLTNFCGNCGAYMRGEE